MKPVFPRFRSAAGLTLVEIIACIGLFSLAVVGIYMSTESAANTVQQAMRVDVESAVANMFIAQVNPMNPRAEVDYDQSTLQTINIPQPNGSNQKIYVTRQVRALDASHADVKQLSVYLYRKPSDFPLRPFRRFKRELTLQRQAYMLATVNSAHPMFYKDKGGTLWSTIGDTADDLVVWGSNDNRTGYLWLMMSAPPLLVSRSAPTNVADGYPWQYCHSANNTVPTTLGYGLFASFNQNYILRLGFAEHDNSVGPGNRKMNVEIVDPLGNWKLLEQVDPVAEVGLDKALVKYYTVQASAMSGGTAAVRVRLTQAGGATERPVLCNIQLERIGGI